MLVEQEEIATPSGPDTCHSRPKVGELMRFDAQRLLHTSMERNNTLETSLLSYLCVTTPIMRFANDSAYIL